MSQALQWAIPDGLPEKMFSGGEAVASVSGRMVDTVDPATGRVIGSYYQIKCVTARLT